LLNGQLDAHHIIRFCSLGSGSKGNATLIAFGETILMIDCGFSIKETIRRLALKGIKPEQITGIIVTHEHSDHISGVAGFSKRFAIPVWLNRGTSLHKKSESIPHRQVFNSHHPFKINDFEVQPIPVPHDSREANQFVFATKGKRIGVLTDVGQITEHMVHAYSGCSALLLEFNYDTQLLMNGAYPYSLKTRVSGDLGHLSNEQSVKFLKNIESSQLEVLAAMHKSEENNCDTIIESHLQAFTKDKTIEHLIATQKEGFEWRQV